MILEFKPYFNTYYLKDERYNKLESDILLYKGDFNPITSVVVNGIEVPLKHKKILGLKTLIEIYNNNSKECEKADPEWYKIIHALGHETIKKAGYVKAVVLPMYNHYLNNSKDSVINKIQQNFKVGEIYTKSFIKNKLQYLGLNKAKASTLTEYFSVKTTTLNGESAFKILSKI